MKNWPIVGVAAATVTVAVIWGNCLLVAALAVARKDVATYGQVGDTFGSVNALFTGIGIIGLVYTL